MKTYTCKLLTNKSPLYFYALYDGSTRLTDAEMDTLFGTAGSAKFRFDFDGANSANVNKSVLYILKNDNISTKIYKQNVTVAGGGIIREGVPFLGTWQNSVTFYTFDFDFGKVLTDDQLTFLMHEIKKKGDVVQTTGTSTTDVMSQDATTKLVYVDNTLQKIQIGQFTNASGGYSIGFGRYAQATGDRSIAIGSTNQSSTSNRTRATSSSTIAIGESSYAGNTGAIAIGLRAESTRNGSVAIGPYAETTRAGEICVGSTSASYGFNYTQYRVIGGVHDPQNDHDAATKGYVDTAVAGAGGATINSTDWSALWQ